MEREIKLTQAPRSNQPFFSPRSQSLTKQTLPRTEPFLPMPYHWILQRKTKNLSPLALNYLLLPMPSVSTTGRTSVPRKNVARRNTSSNRNPSKKPTISVEKLMLAKTSSQVFMIILHSSH